MTYERVMQYDERHNNCPVKEDTRFQNQTWRIQRAAWVIFALIPLVALTGLFAHGYLSDSTASNSGLTVNYERFQRVTRIAHFTFRIADTAGNELRLNSPFQRTYTIEDIQPKPAHSTSDSHGLRLSFDKLEGQTLIVEMWVKPQRFGWRELQAQSNKASLTLNVLIYP
jgi:hypothetical protein